MNAMGNIKNVKMPKAQKTDTFDYDQLPVLLNSCFDNWLKQINTKSSQAPGKTDDMWYHGIVCYLKSIVGKPSGKTQIPAIIIAQHVAYKIYDDMVALDKVFDAEEVEALLTLVSA